MRVFKAAGLLVAVLGLGFSQAHIQSQSTAVQQNSAAPIQPPPDAAVLPTEVQEIEDSLSKIPDRGAALFLSSRVVPRGDPCGWRCVPADSMQGYNEKEEGGSSEAEEIAAGNAIEKSREGVSNQNGQPFAQCHAAEYYCHSLPKD